MKIFLTFLALLMVFLTFFAFQTDKERLWALQDALKWGAEEAAAGATLFYDEAAFGQGLAVIAEEQAARWVQWSMDQLEARLQLQYPGALEYSYRQESGVTARVQVTYRLQKDLFRLPFLSVRQVSQTGTYEVKGYGSKP